MMDAGDVWGYNAFTMKTPNEHDTTSSSRSPAGRATRTQSQRVGAPAAESLWSALPAAEPLLPDSAPETVIRDSLYDVIPLGKLELELIGTPEFVRLQGIKQLGFVYRVFPGATHTRFEHSLGVYFLMLRALRTLLAREETRALLVPTVDDLRTMLAAALLHDIGHYPFSHAIEELGLPIIPHEQVGRHIVEGGSVAEVLTRHGLSPERVARLIDPKRGEPPTGADALLLRLLSGPLDVDKLDYLPRDARGCNVPYGGVDLTRLLGSLRVLHGSDGLRLGVSDKGISPLNSLLHARQEMFDNVYWHHTNRAMMVMLLRATQDALLADALVPDALPSFDDAALLEYLSGAAMPESTRALVGSLRARQPHKVLLEVSARAGRIYSQLDALYWDQAKRRRVELALAEDLSARLGEPVTSYAVLIDLPKPEKWEMDVLVSIKHPPLGMAPLLTWTEATGQRAGDLGIYEQHQRRIRIVGTEALRDRLGVDVEALLLPVLERIPTL